MSSSISLVPGRVFFAALTLFVVSGCTDLGVERTATEDNVQLSVQASASVLHKPSHETLHLTSVKLLIKDIRFAAAPSDDSLDVHAASLVVDLDLDAQLTPVTATRIRSGLYDRVRFILHKPEDDEAVSDPAFRQGTSGDQRFSVVITGYYHETPFTFMSREDARQELRLSPPLLVTDDGTVNLTLKIDPYAWFTRDSLIFDPFNEGKKIDDRIKEVFGQAYRDNDRNGEPD